MHLSISASDCMIGLPISWVINLAYSCLFLAKIVYRMLSFSNLLLSSVWLFEYFMWKR